jgi:hypothetical protein
MHNVETDGAETHGAETKGDERTARHRTMHDAPGKPATHNA